MPGFFKRLLNRESLPELGSSGSGASTRNKGAAGEALAAAYLKKKGYKILETNFYGRAGEVDIIARHKKALVFVEVKARRSTRYGSPAHAVGLKKQRKISMAALEYLSKNGLSRQKARFDVVSVTFEGATPKIEIIPNAFELRYG